MAKSIEEMDTNFKPLKVEGDIQWFDAASLPLEGSGWAAESDAYCRLPERAHGVVREDVWYLSRHSAGLCLRFVTDAPAITARWTLRNPELAMPHMPATGVSGLDLYVRDGEVGSNARWHWLGTGVPRGPENQEGLVNGLEPDLRDYRLYLPLYNGVSQVQIGIPTGSTLRAAEGATPEGDTPKPILFYGTSITHGGCAMRAGMSYPSIIGRHYDWPTINLGFSGNGRAEAEVAALLAELDPAVFVIDCLPNLGEPDITDRVPNLVQTIRNARPATPILLVENITYQNAKYLSGSRDRVATSNGALKAIYKRFTEEGMSGLHYLKGDDLLGHDGEATVDGAHPTDVGFMRMAEVIGAALKPLLQ